MQRKLMAFSYRRRNFQVTFSKPNFNLILKLGHRSFECFSNSPAGLDRPSNTAASRPLVCYKRGVGDRVASRCTQSVAGGPGNNPSSAGPVERVDVRDSKHVTGDIW